VRADTGLNEERVRVICHLPFNPQPKYDKAFRRVIKYIRSQRNAAIPITGYTHSDFRPCVFTGYWWGIPDAKRNDRTARDAWVGDHIVVLMIDLQTNLQDKRLDRFVPRLKKEIKNIYGRYKCRQQEIWIIAHNSFRT
jgi:hypothetical protein